jgi:transposase
MANAIYKRNDRDYRRWLEENQSFICTREVTKEAMFLHVQVCSNGRWNLLQYY